MRWLLFILVALCTGCSASSYNARVFHPWGRENAEDFKQLVDGYENVLVARVSESYWEDRGPHRLTPYHFKGTVFKSYKGQWQVSEQIAFVHYVDAPAPTNAPSVRNSDELMFVFTNEHTKSEVGLGTGEFGAYNAVYAPALERTLPFDRRRPPP
jgi:hypothetical protein